MNIEEELQKQKEITKLLVKKVDELINRVEDLEKEETTDNKTEGLYIGDLIVKETKFGTLMKSSNILVCAKCIHRRGAICLAAKEVCSVDNNYYFTDNPNIQTEESKDLITSTLPTIRKK